MKYINRIVKRIFDIVASFFGIIVLSPILIIVSLFIKIDSKGPIIFKQQRVGQYHEIFNIYKFRTMVNKAESLGKQITVGGDSRITRVGNFIRRYKIDELPQLVNVFLGDMSFVGPRPEVPKYVNLYSDEEKAILEVKPGITDLASLKYSNENDILSKVEEPEKYYIDVIMKDKIKLNLEYIEKNNLFYDIKIIFKTILKCI